MIKIAVYGTLRKGFDNYQYLLSDQEFLGQEIVSLPFKMVSLGGFPGLVASETNNNAVIEVFNVDEEVFRSVDGLEGYPRFYDRTRIKTSYGDAWIYFLADKNSYEYRTVIPNGDWSIYINEKRTQRNEIFS